MDKLEYTYTDTENVRKDLLWWQEQGLSYTSTGYGNKIPTSWKVKHNGRWKRVYCYIYSNSGTCFIMSYGKKIVVDLY